MGRGFRSGRRAGVVVGLVAGLVGAGLTGVAGPAAGPASALGVPPVAASAIDTVAGSAGGTDPTAVAMAPAGLFVAGDVLYITDPANDVVRTVDLTAGTTAVAAGVGAPITATNFAGTRSATSVGLDDPGEVDADAAGTVTFVDRSGPTSYQFVPGGLAAKSATDLISMAASAAGNFRSNAQAWMTLGAASTEVTLTSPDGATKTTLFSQFTGYTMPVPFTALAATPSGAVYGIRNGVVWRLEAGSAPVAVAGTGVPGYSGDGGPATAAQVAAPTDLAWRNGELYIADTGNNAVRKVDAGGTITTIAGGFDPGTAGVDSGDGGLATAAHVSRPGALAFDGVGNLYVGTPTRVRRIALDGTIDLVAGNGTTAVSGDGGPATAAQLTLPSGVAVRADGSVVVADAGANLIRLIALDGTISTIAGTGSATPAAPGAAALATPFGALRRVAIAPNGDVVATSGNRVVRFPIGGSVSPVAGVTGFGFAGDGGPATAAILSGPTGLAFDPSGRLLIADTGNNRVRRVALDGTISTVAGGGADATLEGVPATTVALTGPKGVAAAPDGVIYVADSGKNRVRRIALDGTMTTFAGGPVPVFGFLVTPPPLGDGGLATAALLANPVDVAVGPAGLYISDAGVYQTVCPPLFGGSCGLQGTTANSRVRIVDSGGYIATFVGNTPTFGGDGGPATLAGENEPLGMALDVDGGLLVADSLNRRVRKVGVPGVPFPVAAPVAVAGGDGSGTVTVTWSPPPNDGGHPITGYVVTSTSGGYSCTWSAGPLTCDVTGVPEGVPVSFRVVAQNEVGDSTPSAPSTAVVLRVGGPRYHALSPHRLVDTREGVGGPAAPFGPAESRDVVVAGGATGVPADATAVVLTVTAVFPSAATHVTLWPAGTSRPLASNLNIDVGQVRANTVVATVGSGGAVSVFNNAGDTPVVIDVTGYFQPGYAGGLYVPRTPSRIVDSRDGTGTTAAPWGPAETRAITVAGVAGVPIEATAVVATVTAVVPSTLTHLTVWPTGETMPVASSLNAAAGGVAANTVVATVGAGGAVSVFNNAGSVHVLIDVTGYFRDTPAGLTYHALSPTRLVDTRDGTGNVGPPPNTPAPLLAQTPRMIDAGGNAGVPKGAPAVVATLTAVRPTATTHLSVTPSYTTSAPTSNLNIDAGDVRANTVLMTMSYGAAWMVNNSGATDAIVDVTGYFA